MAGGSICHDPANKQSRRGLILLLEILLSFFASVTTVIVSHAGSAAWFMDLTALRENTGFCEYGSLNLGNSVFVIAVFAAFFMLFRSFFRHYERRRWILSGVLGMLFSAMIMFGKNLMETGSIKASGKVTLLFILALFPAFTAAVDLLFRWLQRTSDKTVTTVSEEIDRKKTAKTFFIAWAIIFIVWIPSFLASYPGVYGYDSIIQINYIRDQSIYLHHPIAHTYLLGFFVLKLGGWLQSYEAGMCCYSIFQMLCLSASLSALYACYIVRRAPRWLRWIVLGLFALFPLNPIMGFSSTKDVLFSAFFALLTLFFLLFAEKPERMRSVKMNVLFVLTAFLFVAFRSQGIYIIAAALLIAFFFFHRYWKNLLAVTGSLLLIVVVYNGPVTKAMGGIPYNSLKEMMSVPCVQLSRVALYDGDSLDPEELTMIKEYIPAYETYEVFPGISDPFKNCLDTERLKKNPMEFIKLYFSVGAKYPGEYVNAFARLTVGYWYPDMTYPDSSAYHPYWEYYPTGAVNEFNDGEKYLLLEQTPVKGFEWLHQIYGALAYKGAIKYVPVVSLLFSSGLPLWILLLFTAYLLYKRQYRYLIVSFFLLLLYGTLFLGPVLLYRYLYPAVLAVPLLLTCALSIQTKERKGAGAADDTKESINDKEEKEEAHG